MKPVNKSSIIICSIVRDAEYGLMHNIPILKDFCKQVKDYKVIIFENDSNDQSKKILKEWCKQDKKVIAFCENFNQPKTIPSQKDTNGINPFYSKKRIEKMVWLRNQYMDYIISHNLDADYILVVDLDVAAIDLAGIQSNFETKYDWDAITAFGYSIGPNFKKRYHDNFALIEYGHMDKPKTEQEIKSLGFKYRYFATKDLVRVDSAFGGLAIYKFESVKGLHYKLIDNNDIMVETKCEHTSIYMQMKERGYDKVYINPQMKIKYQRVTLKLVGKTILRKLFF